jgi:lipopolysaccharide transport system permease protein
MTATGATAETGDVWIIEPRAPGIGARLSEAWRYRYLYSYFVRDVITDIKKQTPLGWLFMVVRAGFPAIVTAFVFGQIAGLSSTTVPFPLFILAGMSVWHLFETSWLWGTRSMRAYAKLVSRIYFPRLLVIPAATLRSMPITVIQILLILGMAFFYLIRDGQWYLGGLATIIIAPVTILLAWCLALSFSLWTSVIEGPARDIRYSLRYLLRFWFFLTPVLYPLTFVPEQWAWVIVLNPLTGIVELWRWGLFGDSDLNVVSVLVSVVTLVLAGAGGLLYFGRAEARMVDQL